MALTYTPRFGLIQWGAGTDAYTRDEANAALETIDSLGAIDVAVADTAHLPPPGVTGRYIWQDDEPVLWRDDGTDLHIIRRLATTAPAALDPSTAGAAGTAETQAHGDHGHSLPAWAALADLATLAYGDAGVAGTGTKLPRSNHRHPMPTHTKADHDALLINAETLQGLSPSDLELAYPAGTVIMVAGAVPAGYVPCDGRTLNRVAYPTLFAAIGTTWGNGDNSGATFSAPDLRGRTPIGAGTGPGLSARAVGQTGGEEGHIQAVGEMNPHRHIATDSGHTHGVSDPTHSHGISGASHSHGVSDPTHSHTINTSSHGHSLSDPGHGHGSSGHAHNIPFAQYIATGTGANGLTASGVSVACDPVSFDSTTADPNVGSGTGASVAGTNATATASAAGTGVSTGAASGATGASAAATGNTNNSGLAIVTLTTTGGGAAANVMQPFGVLTFAIKT